MKHITCANFKEAKKHADEIGGIVVKGIGDTTYHIFNPFEDPHYTGKCDDSAVLMRCIVNDWYYPKYCSNQFNCIMSEMYKNEVKKRKQEIKDAKKIYNQRIADGLPPWENSYDHVGQD